ncbi:MAG: glycosyltransferase [Candidatus Omnitrophota bacterium]|nr:glycosyltransferase [Candidatus Omnitrophota bacterium]
MKVVRLVTRMNMGGPSLHVALLSNGLDPARFSTSLLVGETDPDEGSRLAWVREGPARLFIIGSLRRAMHPGRDLKAFREILRILWKEQPDLIHTHMAKAGALGRLAGILYNRCGPGRRPGKRALLVHTFHGHVLEGYFSPGVSRAFTAIERWLSRRTDCLIAVSETIRDQLLAKGIGKAAQWKVIALGVDFSDLGSLPAPNGAKPFRCGLVGRLVPIKNPALFLQALESISRGHSENPVRGRVIGDGPLRREMEETVRRMGIESVVSFTGWQDDRKRCYEDLDAVCVTSRNEGTPLTLIEAMGAGRVVVSTAVGGVGDLLGFQGEIQPGTFRTADRGLLVRDGDAKGLASALETLAGDPSLRRRIAEAGRSYVRERYSHTRLLKDISDLYDQKEQLQ